MRCVGQKQKVNICAIGVQEEEKSKCDNKIVFKQ